MDWWLGWFAWFDWPPTPGNLSVELLVLLDLAFRVVAASVVSNNRRPSSAVAWLLAIFFIPFLGLFAFILIGSPKLPRRRRNKQRRVSEVILQRTADMDTQGPDSAPPWLEPLARMNRRLGAMPMVAGSDATVETDYVRSLEMMAEEIDLAREYVHAEFYILSLDETTTPVFAALERAVARGVEVRVLFDHLASLRIPGYRRTIKRLDAMGAQWARMLPFTPFKREILRPDLRNHRKLLIIDGAVGYIGSQNLIDARYGKRRNRRLGREWIDIMARFTGPVVLELDAVFRTDWYSETDELLDVGSTQGLPEVRATGDLYAQCVPSGPGFEAENNLKLFNALIYNALHSVRMISPYFVPDESLLMAVTTAAQQGLKVELFVSEQGDQFLVHHAQRSYYEILLDAGVEIWMYPQPYVLHAKTLTVDGQTSVIGSSNLDMRSFTLNLEVSALVEGREFAQDLEAFEDQLRSRSRRLDLAEWRRRPWHEQVADGFCRLTSALM
ncbi:cardiolipin synthase [Arsenicicoccus bolidensis]|uniref:cardiolipin synthase n=1 Tax=Arsenicicoccus bolidensis TaxID=229480 RepID=UPI0003FF1206|nr:cardiolipin synthase [Arsenicicoccus bolidensis]